MKTPTAFLTLSLLLSTGAQAVALFPEDGSLASRKWWISAQNLPNQVDLPILQTALQSEGLEQRELESGYEWSQDISLFDEEGRFLVQAPYPVDGDVLVGLTAGVFSQTDDFPSLRRLTSYQVRNLGLELREMKYTLVEGGEMISGRKANGQPYALITDDVVERAQIFASSVLKRPVPKQEAHELVAADLGLKAENLHVVPFWGHLDLVIQAFPGGRLLVEDPSLAVAALEGASQRSDGAERAQLLALKELHQKGHVRYYSDTATDPAIRGKPMGPARPLVDDHEVKALNRAAEALERAGFSVRRVAGRFWFDAGSWEPQMKVNFLNGAVGRGKSGGLFVITNSSRGLPALEDYWRGVLHEMGVARDRSYFPGFSDDSSGFDCIGSLSP
jgi:hypothetical protein